MFSNKTRSGTILFFIGLSAFLVCFFLGGYRFFRGAWIDWALSGYLSREMGFRIRIYDVRLLDLRRPTVGFGILSVLDPEGSKALFVAGSGKATLLSDRSTRSAGVVYRLHLEDAVIMEDLCRRSPLIDWASRQAFKSPIFLKSAVIVLRRSSERSVARVVSCRSEHLLLNGGIALVGRRIVKAHLRVLLPEEKFEKVPKEIRARMIRRKGGWRGVRLVYHNNLFTAAGDSGPFFQARWGHGQA